MGITKIKFALDLENLFLFLFLAIFPFGQIIRIGIIQPVDVVAGFGAAVAIVKKFSKPAIFRYFEIFLFIAFFSWIFGAAIFEKVEVLYGFLYLIRLAAYFYFFLYLWNFAKKSLKNKNLLIDSLVLVSVFSAVFGWMQYFAFPSIKPFTVWGWDDHLFRLVGTFLDPTFLGIILVLGALVSMNRFIDTESRGYILTFIFLAISILFTYSRASYLAFFAGLSVIAYHTKIFKKIVLVILAFTILVLALPTKGNTVLKFTREFSAIARIVNYKETLQIFISSPVFGVGWDNLCIARAQKIGYANLNSHACSGSDSSIFFILAATGIAGLLAFIYGLISIAGSLKNSFRRVPLSAGFAAVLIHSLFSNSLIYPWVLGYLIILLAATM